MGLTADRRQATSQVLADWRIDDPKFLQFVLWCVHSHGLTAAPVPKPKTTACEIEQRARAAARSRLPAPTAELLLAAVKEGSAIRVVLPDAEWAGAAREVREILSETFQMVRDDVVIPGGPHERRRPERELTYVMQLLDYHLEWNCGMPPMDRYRCISDLLKAACAYLVSPNATKHRLARAADGTHPVGGGRPLWRSAFELAWWRSQQESLLLASRPRFPRRVPVDHDAAMIVDAYGRAVTRRPPPPPAAQHSPARANMRRCLACGRRFRSAGQANRLCGRHASVEQ